MNWPTEAITLRDEGDWLDFVASNAEALLEMYPDLDAAYAAACQGGIEIGGGAAPLFYVSFVD